MKNLFNFQLKNKMKFAAIALIGAVQACDVSVKMFTDAECKTATEDAELKKAADTF